MDARDSILAGLKKLGPSSPRVLADHLRQDPSALGNHLRAMKKEGLIKAAGTTINRVYALPDQKFEEAPPPKAGKKKAKKGKGKKAKKSAAAPRRQKREAEPALTVAITADHRLLLVGEGKDPQIFSVEQTSLIADACLSHFEA